MTTTEPPASGAHDPAGATSATSRLPAILLLARVTTLRLLREGFVVRALLWPGLLCSLAILATAAAYARFGAQTPVLVADTHIAEGLREGAAAAAVGGAMGLVACATAPLQRGFSGPLTRALAAVMLLVSVGYALPTAGRWLPVCSLGARMASAEATLLPAVAALALLGLAALRFHHTEPL